jgi:Phosphoenolpyruvate carboxykinase
MLAPRSVSTAGRLPGVDVTLTGILRVRADVGRRAPRLIGGYTAKVAGTKRGVTEPSATFSPLFGAPLMALHPTVYADLFGAYLEKSGANAWLVNTGWTGGPYGAGQRISIKHSRAVVRTALRGELDDVEVTPDAVFGLGYRRPCRACRRTSCTLARHGPILPTTTSRLLTSRGGSPRTSPSTPTSPATRCEPPAPIRPPDPAAHSVA